MKTISVLASTVDYTVVGDGPGLVLAHGTSMTGQANFGHVVDRLADRWRVVVPDYAGSGATVLPDGELTLDLAVAQLAAVIRDAGAGPVDLVGDSLGAMVATATAARHPDLVRRLVLIAPWSDSSDPRHQLAFGLWARLLTDDPTLSNRFGLLMALSPGFAATLTADMLAGFAAQDPPKDTARRIHLDQHLDIRADASVITAPTLIIAGRNDYLVPEYQSRGLHDLIPGSRYESVTSGHAALLEQPDAVIALIRAFLLDS
ncbi:alpha/beta fold hydrolase [Kutzneria sp. NPDC052558]|uniref:alpha/beta fold hydrolase n=1 Tax=Kutzneria sp. NPDC052558 TaxID=3364121 RepID=UPI0037CB6B48